MKDSFLFICFYFLTHPLHNLPHLLSCIPPVDFSPASYTYTSEIFPSCLPPPPPLPPLRLSSSSLTSISVLPSQPQVSILILHRVYGSASSSQIAIIAVTRPSSPSPPSLPRSPLSSGKHKIAIIGSGSWGTALAKIAAENAWRRKDDFHSEVRMWVREKIVSNLLLTCGHRRCFVQYPGTECELIRFS